MATGTTNQNLFSVHFIESNCQAIVEFSSEFTFDHWQAFMSASQDWLLEGVVNWDLDLRRLTIITSQFLGALVRLNGTLGGKRGLLRIVVEKDSRLANLFYLAKLQRIMTIHEAGRPAPKSFS